MAVTYTVRWRRSDADPEDAWSEESGLTVTSFDVAGLTAGVQYDVEVIAVSGGVQSPATEGSSWTRCAAPTAVTTAAVLAETATVAWTGVTGATAYRIERSTDAETWTTAATTVDGATTSLGVTGLTEQQDYEFRVVAQNSVGDSAASDPSTQVSTLAIATGGTTTEVGTAPNRYRVHTFASGGDFVLNAVRDVEYLLVGGGGGGGARHGGGGGGGGFLTGIRAGRTPGTYPVVVGAGGDGARKNQSADFAEPEVATKGGDSTFDGLTATGGGFGGSFANIDTSKLNGGNGGSGGGVAVGGSGSPGSGSTAVVDGVTVTLGYPGGTAVAAQWPGTGGGGAGEAGSSNVDVVGGAGGAGRASSISGDELFYGGGGGGGGNTQAGLGGIGGGGAGGAQNAPGSPGTDGFGGGGGGARSDTAGSADADGGDGGSGVVILRYLITPEA